MVMPLDLSTKVASIQIDPFDIDKEVRITIEEHEPATIYLTPSDCNLIINTLAGYLAHIREPIELLN